MLEGTYLSNDEIERYDALDFGYRDVCLHPQEVHDLVAGQWLVIDFDHVQFHAQAQAVQLAVDAAANGVWVGLHTYFTKDPLLPLLIGKPHVVVARTHEQVQSELRERSQKKAVGRVSRHSDSSMQETIHDYGNTIEIVAGPRTGPEQPRSDAELPAVAGAGRPASTPGASPD